MQRFTHLAHPLPDIAALLNAVSALNGQVQHCKDSFTLPTMPRRSIRRRSMKRLYSYGMVCARFRIR